MKTVVIIACLLAALVSSAQDAKTNVTKYQSGDVIPLVVMEEVPLRAAVKNLFVNGSMGNYIFDPRVMNSFAGSQGEFAKEPLVSGRWEDHTAEQVLTAILRKVKMNVVTNSANTVKRIVFSDEEEMPPPVNPPVAVTGEVIPLIIMDEVPLEQGILKLAQQAQIKVVFDEKLRPGYSWLGRKGILDSSVCLRWEKLTSRQALDALLDNYGLAMMETPGVASARIMTKGAATESVQNHAKQRVK